MSQIVLGDSKEILKGMESDSVDCCITSPPYFGLRDYGVDGQVGLEGTPELYVEKLVELFREVRRVLKPEGVCWLNLGDSYASYKDGKAVPDTTRGESMGTAVAKGDAKNRMSSTFAGTGIKNKDLIGIPWMVAFALRTDGWYLRQEVIWSKPNPMPESVKDRCTKAHEQVFLLTKSPRYYFNADAIRTPHKEYIVPKNPKVLEGRAKAQEGTGSFELNAGRGRAYYRAKYNPLGANKRTVWTVGAKAFRGAHFATFPEALIEPMVLSGCPEGGVILDPFFGAGTTGMVATKNRREYIGIELNPEYIEIARERLSHLQAKLM